MTLSTKASGSQILVAATLLTAAVLATPPVGAAVKKKPPAPAMPLAAAAPTSEAEQVMCLRLQPGEDLDACVRERRAARAADLRGELDTPANFVANRSLRCEALRGDDRSDCLARMRGEGTVSGSVEGGGILRELVTEVPAR